MVKKFTMSTFANRSRNSPSQLPCNRLLAALPEPEYKRLLPSLKHVTFSLGDILYEPDAPQDYLYFPTTSIVSLLYTTENGMTTGIGSVGSEGAVGITLFMSDDPVPNRAVVQIAGGALRMPAKILQREFKAGGPFQLLLLRYTQAFITQISQLSVCNRLHSVVQRLCYWLLISQDRVNSNKLLITQEFLANRLGTRREGVTVAAGRLQDAGIISYNRGHIMILDRSGLEAHVCECYQVITNAFDHLLGNA